MNGFIEKALYQRRSMGSALADMLVEYQHNPTPSLARKIESLEEEIDFRKGPSDPPFWKALRKIATREAGQS
jgi:hypothetical protein